LENNGDVYLSGPITGIAGCCALAAAGRAVGGFGDGAENRDS